MRMELHSPLTAVKGIGEAKAKLFAAKGIHTVEDLLMTFPRSYQNRGNITPLRECTDGEVYSVVVRCTKLPTVGKTYTGIELLRMNAEDDTAPITVTFFGKRFLAQKIKPGRYYRLYGRIQMGLFGAEATSPDIEPILPESPLRDILPVYPLGEGLNQNLFRSAVENALPALKGVAEYLPEDLRKTFHILSYTETLYKIHRPANMEELEQAKRSAAFRELLIFRLALRKMRHAKEDATAVPMVPMESKLLPNLPFKPTGAQTKAIRQITEDLAKPVPMTRLVQGDVGSGKTIVAAAALELCAGNGMQGVLLAPTEILATQHGEKIAAYLEPLGITTALLTGGMTKKQKTMVKERLATGEIQVLVGTHAVLQEDVSFASLGLVVTDEQHRFGVRQRSALLEKSELGAGKRAHMLVMSATPIPRSLSLILYGDLDVTVLDELPPGRQTIDTLVLTPKDRKGIYGSILRQISQGGQAYIICPLVEENALAEEKSPKKAAETYFRELQCGAFAGIPMGLIHGKQSPAQKAQAMEDFAAGRTKVLVSTTVIEVGVDVPNANVILIENAECFGLSQLHQLRGRVGRGTRKSFCVLVNGSGKPCERLNVMKESSDGFFIAKADLEQRGPGDFFGERQSGELVLRTASLTDMPLIEETGKAMEYLLPEIGHEKYIALNKQAIRMVKQAGSGKTLN